METKSLGLEDLTDLGEAAVKIFGMMGPSTNMSVGIDKSVCDYTMTIKKDFTVDNNPHYSNFMMEYYFNGTSYVVSERLKIKHVYTGHDVFLISSSAYRNSVHITVNSQEECCNPLVKEFQTLFPELKPYNPDSSFLEADNPVPELVRKLPDLAIRATAEFLKHYKVK